MLGKKRKKGKGKFKYTPEKMHRDRRQLMNLIPDLVKDLNIYTISLVMRRCVRKKIAPIWKIGLKQFFKAL